MSDNTYEFLAVISGSSTNVNELTDFLDSRGLMELFN